jgi:aspartyl-tRNA(Asn)/glutamyl-tRNA(Gln) amidotransferase subunit A
MCLGALGTQTGGSVTRPASYCGVYSLKPTYGRVSVDGVLPLAPSLDHVGVMANCVRDLGMMFQAVAGPDERDQESRQSPIPDATTRLGRECPPQTPFWIDRLGGMFRELAEPFMWDVTDDAFTDLTAAHPDRFGHELAVPPAGFSEVLNWHRCIMEAEAAEFHGPRLQRHPDDYPPRIRALVEGGLRRSATDYRHARVERDSLEEQAHLSLFRQRGSTVFLTPATRGPAPPPDTTGDPALNSPWSFLGLPTVSLPVAWCPGQVAGGHDLPLAVQLVAARDAEANLLRVCAWLEAAIGFERRPLPL